MARKVKYVKIPVDFFDSEIIWSIKAAEGADADSIILLYLELFCHAYRIGRRGVFSIGNITLTDETLQSIFAYDSIADKLGILERYGLIKRSEKSIQVFKFWEDLHDRNSVQYKEWRASVFERDGYKCLKCGAKKDIQAHHIKPWKKNKELRYVVSNGETLCRKCHLEAHGGCWRNG